MKIDLIFYTACLFSGVGWSYALYLRQEMKARKDSRDPSTSLGMTEGVGGMTENVDLSGVLAVPDTEAWWRAVNQIVDQAEMETIIGARGVTHDPNRCIAAVGAGEGCDLIRTKLKEARAHALASYRGDIKAKA